MIIHLRKYYQITIYRELDKVGDPLRKYLRNVALLKVLHQYGGILMENSFICMKSLKPIQDSIDSNGKPIVGEFINRSYSSNLDVFSPSMKLIGCKQNCPVINNLIEFMEVVNKRDYTMSQSFENIIGSWLENNINNNNFTYILGEKLGTRINNQPVLIDDLLIESNIKEKIRQKYSYGIYR